MSKKLLEEGSVRSFMKLANLEPLAEQFVQENYGDDDMAEGMYSRDDEMYEEEMPEDEMAPEEEMPEDEMEMEPEMDAAPAGGSENEEVFKDIVAQLADALGVEASIDGDDDEEMPDEEMPDEEGEEMMEMDHGAEEEGPLSELTTEALVAELAARGAITLEENDDEEEEEEETRASRASREETRTESLDEAVEAISKRVAKRLFRK